jgi:hypothetical protein
MRRREAGRRRCEGIVGKGESGWAEEVCDASILITVGVTEQGFGRMLGGSHLEGSQPVGRGRVTGFPVFADISAAKAISWVL